MVLKSDISLKTTAKIDFFQIFDLVFPRKKIPRQNFSNLFYMTPKILCFSVVANTNKTEKTFSPSCQTSLLEYSAKNAKLYKIINKA